MSSISMCLYVRRIYASSSLFCARTSTASNGKCLNLDCELHLVAQILCEDPDRPLLRKLDRIADEVHHDLVPQQATLVPDIGSASIGIQGIGPGKYGSGLR
eukprot:1889232-Rhodomonas_salina.2